MTNRLPALSKAMSLGLYNPEAKMLCAPSQVNLKISPPPESVPDTKRFCADALEQVRIAAPNATMPKNRRTRLKADLNLPSVAFVFIIAPLLWFLLVGFLFYRGSAQNPARGYAEFLK